MIAKDVTAPTEAKESQPLYPDYLRMSSLNQLMEYILTYCNSSLWPSWEDRACRSLWTWGSRSPRRPQQAQSSQECNKGVRVKSSLWYRNSGCTNCKFIELSSNYLYVSIADSWLEQSELTTEGLDEMALMCAERGCLVFRDQDFGNIGFEKQKEIARHFGTVNPFYRLMLMCSLRSHFLFFYLVVFSTKPSSLLSSL